MTVDEVVKIVKAHDFNVTLTGGDPLQHHSLAAVKLLVSSLREAGYSVWCYTGYTFEQLQNIPDMADLLPQFEAVVEGPFIQSLRDTTLQFRGSSNQRIMRPDGSIWQGWGGC